MRHGKQSLTAFHATPRDQSEWSFSLKWSQCNLTLPYFQDEGLDELAEEIITLKHSTSKPFGVPLKVQSHISIRGSFKS